MDDYSSESEDKRQSCPFQNVEVVLDKQYLEKTENLQDILKNAKRNSISFSVDEGYFKASGTWDVISKFYKDLQSKETPYVTETYFVQGEIQDEAKTVLDMLLRGDDWGNKKFCGGIQNIKCNAAKMCWFIGTNFDLVRKFAETSLLRLKYSENDYTYRLSIKGQGDQVSKTKRYISTLYEKETDGLDGISIDLKKTLQKEVWQEIVSVLQEYDPSMIIVMGTVLHIVVKNTNLETCSEFVKNIHTQIPLMEERFSEKMRQVFISVCDRHDRLKEKTGIKKDKTYPGEETLKELETTENNDGELEKFGSSMARKIDGDTYTLQYVFHVCKEEIDALEERYQVSIDDSQTDLGYVYLIFNGEINATAAKDAENAIYSYLQKYHFDLHKEEIELKDVTEQDLNNTQASLNTLAKKYKVRAKIDKYKNIMVIIGLNNVSECVSEVKSLLYATACVKPKRVRKLVGDTNSTSSFENKSLPTTFSTDDMNKFYDFSQNPTTLKLYHKPADVHIHVGYADITKLKVTAIVNAANEQLMNAGGVAQAISKAGGKDLELECEEFIINNGDLNVSENCVTCAGRMSCRKVIHAVGPRWSTLRPEVCKVQLSTTFTNIMKTVTMHSFSSVAIPSISSGIFGVPKHIVAEVMVTSITKFLDEMETCSLKDVHLVDIDYEMINLIQSQLKKSLINGDLVLDTAANDVTLKRKDLHIKSNQTPEDTADTTPAYQNGYLKKNSATTYDTGEYARESNDEEDSEKPVFPSRFQGMDSVTKSTTVEDKGTEQKEEDYITHQNGYSKGNSETTFNKDNTSDAIPVFPSRHRRKDANGEDNNKDSELSSRFHGSKSASRSSAEGENRVEEKEEDICCICMCEITNPKILKCKHIFCTECIDRGLKIKPVCPICGQIFGVLTGNQPKGTMKTYSSPSNLPGYNGCGTITINYNIPSGLQSDAHTNPGQPFQGVSRTAYLPDNEEGREVLTMLKKAWDKRLIFTVGRSVSSGQDNVVTWNDIHHKTNKHGGAQRFGYPDPGYLSRVKEELAAKGIK